MWIDRTSVDFVVCKYNAGDLTVGKTYKVEHEHDDECRTYLSVAVRNDKGLVFMYSQADFTVDVNQNGATLNS